MAAGTLVVWPWRPILRQTLTITGSGTTAAAMAAETPGRQAASFETIGFCEGSVVEQRISDVDPTMIEQFVVFTPERPCETQAGVNAFLAEVGARFVGWA